MCQDTTNQHGKGAVLIMSKKGILPLGMFWGRASSALAAAGTPVAEAVVSAST